MNIGRITLLAACLALGAASSAQAQPAAENGVKIGVMPLTVTGHMGGLQRSSLEDHAATGLMGGRSKIVIAADVRYDDPEVEFCDGVGCASRAARATGSAHMLRTHVEIDGLIHKITMSVVRGTDESKLAEVNESCDRCTLEQIGKMVQLMAGGLREQLEIPAATAVEPEAVSADAKRPRRATSPIRGTGWALFSIGVAGVGAGATLLALDGREIQSQCSGTDVDASGNCRFQWNTLGAGAAAATVGAALFAAGITAIILGGKSRDSASASVSVGPGRIGIQGRF